MSKSLKRVRAALEAAGLPIDIHETQGARTAEMAANAVGCHLDQIAKSIIFRGETNGAALLFLTAGGNQVDIAKASALAGEPLPAGGPGPGGQGRGQHHRRQHAGMDATHAVRSHCRGSLTVPAAAILGQIGAGRKRHRWGPVRRGEGPFAAQRALV